MQVRWHVTAQNLPAILGVPLRALRHVAAALVHVVAAAAALVRLHALAHGAAALQAQLSPALRAHTRPVTPHGLPALRRQPRQPLAGSLAVLAAAAVALAAAHNASSHFAHSTSTAPSDHVRVAGRATAVQHDLPAMVPTVADAAARTDAGSEQLTMPEVKNTVLAWVEAKARAMGPQHDVGALDSVLQGPMLRDWRRKAVNCRSNNWHWSYAASDIVVRLRPLSCATCCLWDTCGKTHPVAAAAPAGRIAPAARRWCALALQVWCRPPGGTITYTRTPGEQPVHPRTAPFSLSTHSTAHGGPREARAVLFGVC